LDLNGKAINGLQALEPIFWYVLDQLS